MGRTLIIFLLLILHLSGFGDRINWAAVDKIRDQKELAVYLDALEDSLDKTSLNSQQYLKLIEPVVNQHQNSPVYIRFLFLKSQYYYQRGDYQPALDLYLQCADVAEKLQHREDYIRAMSNVATIYARLNNFEESNAMYRRLIPLARKLDNSIRLLVVYVNLANNYVSQHLLDSAAYYYQQALFLTKEGSFYRAAVEINLARLSVQAGDAQKARDYARRSAAFADSVGNMELYVESLANIINSYLLEKRFQEALPVAFEVERISRKSGLRMQLKDVYINLAEIFKGLQQFNQALWYYQKYSALKDSIFSEEMSRQINELKIQYDLEKKEKELLMKEGLIKKKEIQVRYLIAGISGVLFFSLIIMWLYSRQRTAYQMLVKKSLQWSQPNLLKSTPEENGARKRNLNERKKREILTALEARFIRPKLYLHSDMSIEKLASLLNTNSKYLSEVIREVYDQSFPQFLNNLRIQEAIRLFKEDDNQLYSIEGISKSVGFNSKSTFNLAFKKITGVTPSYFRKELKRLQSE